MWFRDIRLPGFLSGELDVDGVDVGGWNRVMVRGEEELRCRRDIRGMEGVQGRQGGHAGG